MTVHDLLAMSGTLSPRESLLQRAAYAVIAVVASTFVTAFFSLMLNGAVLGGYIITGVACSLVVSWFMVAKAQALQEAAVVAMQREASLKAKAERLDLVRGVIREVNHHVNNLSNNLQLIELEYTRTERLTPQTLAALKEAIGSTTHAIASLNHAADADPDRLVARQDAARE